MRRYTGEVVLELEDKATGSKESVMKTNMVTNLVNDLLGMNPMGLFYKSSEEYDEMFRWNDEMLPICPNMVGGILLFPRSLDEDAENIYPPSDNLPVAYASNNVNSTSNLQRGSMNLTESKVLPNGFKFVWEFTPSQGNGTIAAIGLTSKQGGTNLYGSDVAVNTTLLRLRKNTLNPDDKLLRAMFRAVDVDQEKGLMYSINYGSPNVTVSRYRMPIFDVGLNEKLDDTSIVLEDNTTLECGTFKFLGDYKPYGIFLDGFDGYWYGFSNEGNSSGSATMLWIKIKKSDLSFTEGEWTLSNAKLKAVGCNWGDTSSSSSERNAVVRNGYLYVLADDDKGIYKINVANPTDVTLIPFGFASDGRPMTSGGSCDAKLLIVGDIIYGYDYIIDATDTVTKTSGGTRVENLATPLFRYKEFVFGWGGSYSNCYRYNYLLTPYLATICNLGSVVVKNADKTMKVTYTLTEEVVGG